MKKIFNLLLSDSINYVVIVILMMTSTTVYSETSPANAPIQLGSVFPQFPKEFIDYRVVGRTDVFIKYSENDQINEVIVVNSDHHLFEKATLDFILKATFTSQIKDGKKVAGGVLLPINYRTNMGENKRGKDNNRTPYAFPDKPDSKLPLEFQYDVPPLVTLATSAVYPYSLMKQNISGKATVTVAINPKGEVSQVKIVNSTKPEFGEATKAMMESWKFQPASKAGKNIWSYFVKEQTFGSGDNSLKDTSTENSYVKLMKVIITRHKKLKR